MGKKIKNKNIDHEVLPISYDPINRRLFFKSSMGLLAVPFLSSLLPRQVWAMSENEEIYKRAVFMVNRHGGHCLDARPKGVNYSQVSSGVYAGDLSDGQLGPIYSNSFNAVKSKLSVIMGLDIPGACGHVTATSLAGSFSITKTDGSLNELSSDNPNSIDTLIARKIYHNSHPLKVLRLGGRSHCFEDGSMRKGITTNAAYDLLFANISSGGAAGATNTSSNSGASDVEKANLRRKFVLENILSAINVNKKNARIPQSAKAEIGDYQDLLSQIKNSIQTETSNPAPPDSVSASCNSVERPGGDDLKHQADLIVAALRCGATRLAYMGLPTEHHYVHRVSQRASRLSHQAYLRTNLDICAYLMNQLDQFTDPNGKTILENSIVLHTSDLASSKFDNHCGVDARVLVGGSLGGKFKMGKAVQYKSDKIVIGKSNASILANGDGLEQDIHGGRVYNELLISIMRGFGLSQNDYSINNKPGFGHYHIDEARAKAKIIEKALSRDIAQSALQDYLKNYFLKNYQRDSTLPYIYNT